MNYSTIYKICREIADLISMATSCDKDETVLDKIKSEIDVLLNKLDNSEKIMARKKINPADIQHIDLENVRHSDLGAAIELLEDNLPDMEAVYLLLRDSSPKIASDIRQALESIDYVMYRYNEVR